MSHDAHKVFSLLTGKIDEDPAVRENQKPGLCRPWSDAVMDVIEKEARKIPNGIAAEARQVQLEPFLWHTFVLLTIDGVQYVDSIGTEGYPPYRGLLAEAPEYLQQSAVDPINIYRSLDRWIAKATTVDFINNKYII